MSETMRALEEMSPGDRARWGMGKGPSALQRAALWSRFLAGLLALGALSAGWLAIAKLTPPIGMLATGVAAAIRGVAIGLAAFPISEMALGLCLGAGWRRSWRVAAASARASGWIGLAMAWALPAIALWIAGGLAARAGAAKSRGLFKAPWEGGACCRWMERGSGMNAKEIPLLRASEYGPLAAWGEARSRARLGDEQMAMEIWRRAPFDPGWIVIPARKGAPAKTLSDLARHSSEWRRSGGFWPDAGELDSAVERATLEREAGRGIGRRGPRKGAL